MKVAMSASAVSLAESQWVQAELIRTLIVAARTTQRVGWLLIPVYVGVLWSDAGLSALAVWGLLAVAVAIMRAWVIAHYGRHVRARPPVEQLMFFNRWRHVWTASALVWGSTVLLYFDRLPLSDQFICWLIMASVAMFAINSFSCHLQTMRIYLNVLALVPMAVMVWRIAVELQFEGPTYHYWLVTLTAIFWLLLRQAGQRQHLTHLKNFELQYRNNQLIESLRRQTQAALEAVEIKNRFLASAAHDIRQPVHALGLYAGWLDSEPELVKEIAPKIVESTKAVNALFDSLFDMARLDSGKIKLNIESIDIAKLLRDLQLRYLPLAQAKGLELRVRVVPGIVVSDPILLQRIVGNLVSNAIKYTQSGGVLLAARQTGGDLNVEVWDTGSGIAPIHQRDIFREFYKVPAHAGTEDGFGLGLYIVARLSGILGHPLALKSRPGRGTVFRLFLKPTNEADAQARALSPAAIQPLNMP